MQIFNTLFRFSSVLAVTALMTGCANNPLMSNSTTATTAGGVGLGAIAGAVIGNQVGAPMAGAALGAGLGGLAGYGVARSSQQPQQYQQQPGFYQPPANNPQCPSGYNCTPVAPVCPHGYTCSPAG